MTLAHQSCIVSIQNRSPERGRCGRPTKARWPCSPSWYNSSDESGSSQLIGNKELSSENGVGRPWRPTVTGWFQRLWLEKRLEAGAKGIPGSVLSKYYWRQIWGTTKHTAGTSFLTLASDSPPGNPLVPSAQPYTGLPNLSSPSPSTTLVETTFSSYLNLSALSHCPSASAIHPFHSPHQTWTDHLTTLLTTSPLAY